jgi:hypothetical protein
MLRKLRPRRPSHATVVAYLALFVALGGTTAWAAHERILSSDIVDNEVFTTDVRDDTLGFGGLLAQDLAPGSVTGSEVLNETMSSFELGPFSVLSSEVADGQLNDEDISQSRAVDFVANIGTVNSNSCVDPIVSGLGANRDHLLLTPHASTAHAALTYDARYLKGTDDIRLIVCNFSNAAINDGTTNFNLLVIDAQ